MSGKLSWGLLQGRTKTFIDWLASSSLELSSLFCTVGFGCISHYFFLPILKTIICDWKQNKKVI